MYLRLSGALRSSRAISARGANSGDEKTCGEDYVNSGTICAIILGRFYSFVATTRFRVGQSGDRTSEACPAQTSARDRRISVRRLCLAEFYQRNLQYLTVCQILRNPGEVLFPPPGALGGEHFYRRNLHFNGSPKKLKQDSNPFFRRQ